MNLSDFPRPDDQDDTPSPPPQGEEQDRAMITDETALGDTDTPQESSPIGPEPDPLPKPNLVPEPEPVVPLLNHYLLVQLAPAQADLRPLLLHLASGFILDRGATVGFDPVPARQSARVTVIGSLDPTLAAELAAANIPVEIVAADPFTLESALEALP